MLKIKVAFVGAGFMAEQHVRAFADIENIELIGIYSRTNERSAALANKYGILHIYESIEELYEVTTADLVVVAVSELSVNSVCKSVFKYPWRVLIEKPVGYNLADAEDIYFAAEKAKCHAFAALNRRHYSTTRAVIREIENVDGQRLVHVFDQENPKVALEGGRPALVVDNWMYANSIHTADYLSLFCRGVIVSVENVIKWNSKRPSFVLAKINYSSGDIGIYQAVWNAPGPWAVSITTQAQRWEMRPLEQATSQLYQSKDIRSIPLHHWDVEFKAGLRLQAQECINAVSGRKHKLPSLVDAIETMKLISKIYES